MHIAWYLIVLFSGVALLLLLCALLWIRWILNNLGKAEIETFSNVQRDTSALPYSLVDEEKSLQTQIQTRTEATPLLRNSRNCSLSGTCAQPRSSIGDNQKEIAQQSGSQHLPLSSMRRQSSGLYNIGTIQPELYLRRGSVLTQASGSDYAVGVIRLRLSYDFGRCDFIVRILEVNIELSDVNRCQIVVSLYDGFDETFFRSVEMTRSQHGFEADQPTIKLPVPIGELVRRKLHIKLLALEPKKDYIGAVELDLLENDPSADIEVAAELENRPDRTPELNMEQSYNGELELSLKYMISIKRLVVSVLRTKGVIMSKDALSTDRCGVWAKVKLWQEEKVVKKKKTQAVRFSNPLVLNQAVSFTLNGLNVQSLVLEIQLFEGHQWRLASNFLGRVVLGERAPTTTGQLHWNSAILQGEETTVWHPLISWIQAPERRYSQ